MGSVRNTSTSILQKDRQKKEAITVDYIYICNQYIYIDYIKNISTFADFLLKLVFVAAIASTIGSVVGYRMAITIERQQADKNKRIVTIESKKDKWINRIQKYSLYDLVALVFVSVIILKETVITNLYSLEYPYLVIYPVIIIVGLGWGLLSQIVYYQISSSTLLCISAPCLSN